MSTASKLKLKYILKLLIKALEKERESQAWDMWLILYPRMNKETFMSFEDYKIELFKPINKRTEKTSEEIMAEMLPIIAAHEKRQ